MRSTRARCRRHASLQANGINGDLRRFPADVSISCLDCPIGYAKAILTAVLGYELHRLRFKVSAAGVHVANADCLVGDINDLRLSKEATASQQDGWKRNPGYRFQQIPAHNKPHVQKKTGSRGTAMNDDYQDLLEGSVLMLDLFFPNSNEH